MLLSLTLAWLSFFTPSIESRLVNVTIDDTFGDPTTGEQFAYLLPVSWTPGQDCPTCSAQPDRSLAYNGTWHDASFRIDSLPLNASVSFNGQALYVYCIISNNQDQNSDMTFYIDNEVVGSFVTTAPGGNTYDYNTLVYQNQALNPGQHTFMLASGHPNGPDALVLLDYVVYTVDVEDSAAPSAESSPSTTLPASGLSSSLPPPASRPSPSLPPPASGPSSPLSPPASGPSSSQPPPASGFSSSLSFPVSGSSSSGSPSHTLPSLLGPGSTMGGSGSAAQTASMSSMSSSGTASAAAAVAGSSSKNGLSSTQLKLIIIIAVVVGLSFALCTLAISWYWRRLASRPGRTWLPRGICCLSRKKQATIEPFLAEPSTPVPEMKGNISPGGNSMLSDASSMSPLLHHTHAVMSDQSNVNTGGHRIPGSMRRDSAMVPADTSSRFRLGDLRVEGSANESQTTTNEPVLWIPIPQRGQQGVIDVNNIAGNPSMTTPASTIPSPTSSSDLLVIPQARHLASILAPDIESPMTPPPMYRERD